MLDFMDFMNQKLQVGQELDIGKTMRADKTKWWNPHNARCRAFFLEKKIGQGKHSKYFIGAWQGKLYENNLCWKWTTTMMYKGPRGTTRFLKRLRFL
jgi:hypothetical protein